MTLSVSAERNANTSYYAKQQKAKDAKKTAQYSNTHQLQRFHNGIGPGLKNNYIYDHFNKSRIVKAPVYNCGYATSLERKKCGYQ